jgi:hypothetical protein
MASWNQIVNEPPIHPGYSKNRRLFLFDGESGSPRGVLQGSDFDGISQPKFLFGEQGGRDQERGFTMNPQHGTQRVTSGQL